MGLMYIGVATNEAEQANLQGPHCVFQQAALLSNTEVMIQAIELWQEIDLDLVPCEAPENTSLHLSLQLNNNSGSNAEAQNAGESPTSEPQRQGAESGRVDIDAVETGEAGEQDAKQGSQAQAAANPSQKQQRIVMVFDCATLVQLKSLSQELQSVLNVTSSSIELHIQLDQLNIPPEEMAKIENGAVVVIPAAYQPEWGIVAISATPEVPLKFNGSVKKSDEALQLQISGHEANSSGGLLGAEEMSDDTVSLWCKQLCSIPVKELLGMDTSAQAAQLLSLDARELKLVQGESTIAHGSLLPYGRGSVLAVSERLMD